MNSYLIISNKDLYYWYCHTLGKKGGGKGLRGRNKPLPCGIIVCSLPFRLEVSLGLEGGINVFSSYLEMAAKALVSFCLIPRKVPVSLRERCLVVGFLQHPPRSPSFAAPAVLSQPKRPPASWEVNAWWRQQKPWGISFPLLLSPCPAQGRKPLHQPHFRVLTAQPSRAPLGADAAHPGVNPPLRVSYPTSPCFCWPSQHHNGLEHTRAGYLHLPS